MDNDGEWLYNALVGGTLEISHIGSYQVELDTYACVEQSSTAQQQTNVLT